MINLILLAAGKSERMGTPKLLMPFAKQVWADFQFSQIRKLNQDIEIRVVVRSELFASISHRLAQSSIRFVENSMENSEPWQSLEMGLRAGRPGPSLISPIDVPLDVDVMKRILTLAPTDLKAEVIVPEFQNRRGHPVFLSEAAVEKFLDSPERLDNFTRKCSLVSVPVQSHWIHLNLNDPQRLRDFEDQLLKHDDH